MEKFMPNEVRKRYVCSACNTEMLVTRAGEGTLTCCGQPMQIRGAAAAPKTEAQEAGRG
jgi:desulfoferrodoxin-like iron-binding protein